MTRLGLWVEGLSAAPGGPDLLAAAVAVAQAAERSGFDSLFVSELADVPPGGPPGDRPAGAAGRPSTGSDVYEVYSLLGALAARTGYIHLGAVPCGAERRPPAVLAKIVTAVDVISHGRGELVLGVDPDSGDEGIERLAERLQVCRAVMEDESPSFAGRFYEVSGAVNRPAPVQPGGVPLVVFTQPGVTVGPELLRVAGHYADAVVLDGDDGAVAGAVELIGEAASSNGRSPSSVQLIWRGGPGRRPDELAARLRAGADGCIVSLAGADLPGAIERLGPELRDAVDSVPARVGPGRS